MRKVKMWRRSSALGILLQSAWILAAPAPKGWNGTPLGQLSGGASGEVYVVNETTIQVVKFKHEGDKAYFWFDAPDAQGKVKQLYKLNKESGFLNGAKDKIEQESDARFVINVPGGRRIFDHSKFGLYSEKEQAFISSVQIPNDVQMPQPQNIGIGLKGNFYNVKSDPIVILNRRTLIIPQFNFQGDKPPDGYIFVGKAKGAGVHGNNGNKCFVEGWDVGNPTPLAMQKPWVNQDIIAYLPEDKDIYDMDYISVYCFAVGVDFGHIDLPKLNENIPPAIPPVVASKDVLAPWKESALPEVREFEVKLGPPGRKRGYEAIRGAKANEWVFYINGYMTPVLKVRRGITYRFSVYGGQWWRMYISSEESGGYNIKPENERPLVKVFASQTQAAEQLCWFGRKNLNEEPDSFDSFDEFKKALYEQCQPENGDHPAVFEWTPDGSAPSTAYYGALNQYNMGWKIEVQ